MRHISILLFLGFLHIHAGTGVSVTTKFDGGNGKIKITGDTVKIAPDLRGGRNWFYWYIEASVTQAGEVRFDVAPQCISKQGPALSLDQGKTWKYVGSTVVKDNAYVHSMIPGKPIRLAVAIPYVKRDLDKFLRRNNGNAHLTVGVLSKTKSGRDVPLLQIGKAGADKQAVFFAARHHACESTASFLLEGFMQAAIADTADGRAFRSKHVLYVVPIVDADGVALGDQGKGRSPHDHNRDYGKGSLFPEIDAIEKLAIEKKIRFAVDWHCPTLLMGSHQVLYFCGNKLMPQGNHSNVSNWTKEIKKAMPKGGINGPAVWLKPAAKKNKGGLCSGYFAYLPGMIMSTTIEVPFASPGKKMDAASVRSYGEAFLKGWVKTEFDAPDLYEVDIKNAEFKLIGSQRSTDNRYVAGTVIDLTAEAAPSGKIFDKWTGDTTGIANVYDPTITLKTPAKDMKISASFRAPGRLYPLSVTKGTSAGKYAVNQVIDIKADAAPDGQAFHKWAGDTKALTSVHDKETSLTMPAKALSIRATYRGINKELIGHWDFEKATATAIPDTSGNGHSLKTSGLSLVSGKLGKAGSFTAKTRGKHPTLLSDMPKELTIACWVKASAQQPRGLQAFLQVSNRPVYEQMFAQLQSRSGKPGQIRFSYRVHGPGMGSISGGNWQADTWYHYAITWDRTGVKLYINGEEKAKRKSPGPIASGKDQPFQIGGFNCVIDDLRIYGVSLKAAEIKAISQGM